MSSWDLGHGPPLSGTYHYSKPGENITPLSENQQHNNTNQPPFRTDTIPISPHLSPPPLLDPQNHHLHLPGGQHPHYGHGHPHVLPPGPAVTYQHHQPVGLLPPVTIPPYLHQQHYSHPLPPPPGPGIHPDLHHHPVPTDPYNVGLRLPTTSPLPRSSALSVASPVPHTPQVGSKSYRNCS